MMCGYVVSRRVFVLSSLVLLASGASARAEDADEAYFTIRESSTELVGIEVGGQPVSLKLGPILGSDLGIPTPVPNTPETPTNPAPTPTNPLPSNPSPTNPYPNPLPTFPKPTGPSFPELDLTKVIFDTIMNMGKQLWQIVEAGRPVSNIISDTASALPKGVDHWMQLDSWKRPVAYVFKARTTNKYKMDVVSFEYRLTYTYNGSAAGTGRYLTEITVVPAKVNVSWGYALNAKTSVPSVFNTGTHDAPVAAAQILVNWKVSTPFQTTEETKGYYVDGLGTFAEIPDQPHP